MICKMFYSQSITKLEKDINNYLMEHPRLQIKHVTQSEDCYQEGESTITITIYYEEDL